MKKYHCLDCGSDRVLVYESTAYELNTGDFYCHSVKAHDHDAEVGCVECDWRAKRFDLDNEAAS